MSSDPRRVRIDQRATKSLVELFTDKVRREHGQTDVYAGIEFERMAKWILDEGDLGEVRAALDDLQAAVSVEAGEKKSLSGSGETVVINYRINEQVRARLLEFADEDTRSYRGVVDLVLVSYIEATPEERLRDGLQAATEAVTDVEDDDRTTTERIIDRLAWDEELLAFRLSDFVDAAEAEGIGTREYAIERYLPCVLETAGLVPVEKQTDPLFLSPEQPGAPDHGEIDPRLLPYDAMNDADIRVALKAEALERAANRRGGRTTLSVDEGKGVLGGKPRPQTVRTAYQEIEETAVGGFAYTEHRGEDRLVASVEPAQDANVDNERALRLTGLYAATLSTEVESGPAAADGGHDGGD